VVGIGNQAQSEYKHSLRFRVRRYVVMSTKPMHRLRYVVIATRPVLRLQIRPAVHTTRRHPLPFP